MRRMFSVLLAVAATSVALEAGTPQQAFVKGWVGRAVTVKAPLYTLVYNERGKLGTTRHGLVEGVTVATASGAAYLRFDGRQGRDEVVQQDPRQFVAAVNSAYDADVLDVRSYRKLEALKIRRYDPGFELRVLDVRVDRDLVRFEFANPGGTEPVTGITIRWPAPLSKSFEEREAIETVIRQFVESNDPARPAA